MQKQASPVSGTEPFSLYLLFFRTEEIMKMKEHKNKSLQNFTRAFFIALILCLMPAIAAATEIDKAAEKPAAKEAVKAAEKPADKEIVQTETESDSEKKADETADKQEGK